MAPCILLPTLAAGRDGDGHVIDGAGAFDGSSGYLTWTNSSSGDRNVYTREAVVRRHKLGATQYIFDTGPDGGNNLEGLYFDSNDRLNWVINDSNVIRYQYITTAKFRDIAGFYHIVAARSGSSLKLYVNGVEITAFDTSTNTGSTSDGRWSHTDQNVIGRYFLSGSNYLDATVARVVHVDGQQLDPTSFTETTDDGYLNLLDVSGLTFGTTGFLMEGQDVAGGTVTAGTAHSVTKNGTITAVNTSPTDSVEDGVGLPATLSNLSQFAQNVTLSNGNRAFSGSSASSATFGNLKIPDGSWYWEVTATTLGAQFKTGVATVTADLGAGPDAKPGEYQLRVNNGNLITDGSEASHVSSIAAGSVVGVAVKKSGTSLKVWFADDGSWVQGDPATDSSPSLNVTEAEDIVPSFSHKGGSSSYAGSFNFGQEAFAATAPSGFEALATQNFSEPAIPDPGEHHQTALVSHDGSSTAFTLNWDADVYDTLFILKNRDSSENWFWIDTLRGVDKILKLDINVSETTDANVLSVSGTTVTLGATLAADDYVIECHKAGLQSARNTNTTGSITTTTTVNDTSLFGIMTYTGNTTAGATTGHDLGVKPDVGIFKNRTPPSNNEEGEMYFSPLGASYAMELPRGDIGKQSSQWNSTEPTSTVFTLGGGARVNDDTMVCWYWAAVEGYSAFDLYEGNGSTDGPMAVYNFRPATILTRQHDAGRDWRFYFDAFLGYNPSGHFLAQNEPYAQSSETGFDFLSNGAKIRINTNSVNISGGGFIRLAWGGRPIQGGSNAATQGRAR